MFNIFSCSEDKEELESYYQESYYEDRSHIDTEYQYCHTCGDDREFLFDRCMVCKSN